MKTILFVDHFFHEKTKSSNFFLDILSSQFKIQEITIDPDKDFLENFSLPSNIDGVVIWQLDYLAPFFLNLGIPTVVVPMFDGSFRMPVKHWKLMADAQAIFFSLEFQLSVKHIFQDALLVKFFPEIPKNKVINFNKLNAFFWERRPKELPWTYVNHIIGSQLDLLHIHNHPDSRFDVSHKPITPYCNFNVTDWFEDSKDLDSILETCNVFVAPRLTEGIGLSFLEAMARGMCVLANRASTHDEYICHNYNGILFEQKDQVISLDKARILGSRARETMEIGRKSWLEHDLQAIIAFVHKALSNPIKGNKFSSSFIDNYFYYHSLGLEQYEEFLNNSDNLLFDDQTSSVYEISSSNAIVFNCDKFQDLNGFSLTRLSNKNNSISAIEAESGFTIRAQTIHPLLISISVTPLNESTKNNDLSISIQGTNLSVHTKLDSKKDILIVIPKETKKASTFKLRFKVIDITNSGAEEMKDSLLFQIDEVRLVLGYPFEQNLLDSIYNELSPYFDSKEAFIAYAEWAIKSGLSLYQLKDYSEFRIHSISNILLWALREDLLGMFSLKLHKMIWTKRLNIPHRVLGAIPFHEIHQAVYNYRTDVQEEYKLYDSLGLAGFLGWYYTHGLVELCLERCLSDEEIAWLIEPISLHQDNGATMPRLIFCIWCSRFDFKQSFNISQEIGLCGLVNLLLNEGLNLHHIPEVFHNYFIGFGSGTEFSNFQQVQAHDDLELISNNT